VHPWYWSEEKRQQYAAPEETMPLEDVIAGFGDVQSGHVKIGVWLLDANVGKKQDIAKRLCDSQDWKVTAM
jgi:hypothetical protein